MNRISKSESGGKKGRWIVLFFVIAALTIWAVTSQWKGFTLAAFFDFVSGADVRWLSCAVLAMLGFVAFEGFALHTACHGLHNDVPLRKYVGYASADIYFSAITPSASGGQPACALLMMRDGIPGIVATAVLLLTLSMYALSILAVGMAAIILDPSILSIFGVPSLVLIGIGFAVQVGLAVFLLLLIRSEHLLEGICRGTIHLLARLHLIHNEDRRQLNLRDTMAEYARCLALLSGHRTMLTRAFLFNLLQRVSQLAVTVFVFLSKGGVPRMAGHVFAMQTLVVIGSNCIPVPGAMGVADYLMLDGFEAFLPADQVIGMELMSRSISFYSCVLLCGLIVLITTYRTRKADGR